MLPLDEALRRVVAPIEPLADTEDSPLAEALGRTLGAQVRARFDQPAFDNSAMDGWAVRTTDISSARSDHPVTLARAPGESRAGGSLPAPLAEGRALRIYTGAPFPPGADAVVIQEDVESSGERLRFAEPARPWQNVRRRGSDFAAGAALLDVGEVIVGGAIALLASQGFASVATRRPPRVAIVPTGDELRPIGSEAEPGAVYDSNGPMLAALVREVGGEPRPYGAVGDDDDALARTLERALTESDLVLTTGGVSVGEHDRVKEVLARLGVRADLWRVALKPGKPLAAGSFTRGGIQVPVLGLPGNPVSAFVTFHLFAASVVRRLLGQPHPLPARLPVIVGAAVRHRPGRAELARVTLARRAGEWIATPHANQGSGAPDAIGQCDALLYVPSESQGLEAGSTGEVWMVRPLPREPLPATEATEPSSR
jgi:molybdopterin molybdotransferase